MKEYYVTTVSYGCPAPATAGKRARHCSLGTRQYPVLPRFASVLHGLRFQLLLLAMAWHMAAAGGGGPGASSLLYSTPSRSRSVDRSHVPFRFQSLTTRETLICPGWETSVVPVSQPGTPGRDKRGASATCLAHPFVPVGVTNRDKRSIFFSCFSFLNSFSISIIILYFN